jgi:hypothetical protein
MSNALTAIFVLAAAHGAWRTRRIATGILTASGAAVLGGAISVVGTAVMLVLWHDPATLVAWETSGGIGEAVLFVPLLLIPISLVTGTAGALLGRLLPRPAALALLAVLSVAATGWAQGGIQYDRIEPLKGAPSPPPTR